MYCVSQMQAATTSAGVLIPEEMTGSLVVPPIPQAGVSVAQLAYDALRGAILAMDAYDPDADLRLDEKRLAAELGVSRTPVREALSRLEHQGLVTILPRRGVYVARKSKAEIIEMIIAWAALEGMAARLMCERADDEESAACGPCSRPSRKARCARTSTSTRPPTSASTSV